jgi:hypothetical protein
MRLTPRSPPTRMSLTNTTLIVSNYCLFNYKLIGICEGADCCVSPTPCWNEDAQICQTYEDCCPTVWCDGVCQPDGFVCCDAPTPFKCPDVNGDDVCLTHECCTGLDHECPFTDSCLPDDTCCSLDPTKHVCLGPDVGQTTNCQDDETPNNTEACCDNVENFYCPILSIDACVPVSVCCDKGETWCDTTHKCIPDTPEAVCDCNGDIFCVGQCVTDIGDCCPPPFIYDTNGDLCLPPPCVYPTVHCPESTNILSCDTCCEPTPVECNGECVTEDFLCCPDLVCDADALHPIDYCDTGICCTAPDIKYIDENGVAYCEIPCLHDDPSLQVCDIVAGTCAKCCVGEWCDATSSCTDEVTCCTAVPDFIWCPANDQCESNEDCCKLGDLAFNPVTGNCCPDPMDGFFPNIPYTPNNPFPNTNVCCDPTDLTDCCPPLPGDTTVYNFNPVTGTCD